MHFVQTVAVVFCLLSLISVINSQNDEVTGDADKSKEKTEEKETEKPDVHTFVVLIDILFTEGSKKTCTGTIIHENVVITAAHCFTVEDYENISPELTLSFVVLGTKKMYESGYEQYLPIERVVMHPKFKKWTADLALVYTFADMTSDKPGRVIPLLGERTSSPLDSNLTILSWGQCPDDILQNPIQPRRTTRNPTTPCADSTSDEESCKFTSMDKNYRLDQKLRKRSDEQNVPVLRHENDEKKSVQRVSESNKGAKNRSSTSNEGFSDKKSIDKHGSEENLNDSYIDKNTTTRYKTDNSLQLRRRRPILTTSKRRQTSKSELKSIYRNWRRHMGILDNKLTVETFGFVNVQTCKKVVERAKSKLYQKDGNDIVCYSSEDHYLTNEDAGAPALSQNHLVAVTVGGTRYDGDHVAVGMRMSCFCQWIAENLPTGGENIKCCKDCCDIKEKKTTTTVADLKTHKYLRMHRRPSSIYT